MPLDQDVSDAVLMLHFGMTLPFWTGAVAVQAGRLEPREAEVTAVVAAVKRREANCALPGDDAIFDAFRERQEAKSRAGLGGLVIDTQDAVDGAFLVVAIRNVLSIAERSIIRLTPIGKHHEVVAARDQFVGKFGFIKDLRDILMHYDEYATGGGRLRNLRKNASEGATVTFDEDGYFVFSWAGHEIRLLDCADAALELSRRLEELHWWPVFQS